jgi:tRNA(Ile2)-agmatinylcytidine synthase
VDPVVLTEFHIGIDDTDSPLGGCTTYTTTLMFQELFHRNINPTDFPWLVRLNPNVPWKTRGNGATAIHLVVEEEDIQLAEKIAIEIVEKTTDTTARRTDPAIAFLKGRVSHPLRGFSNRALHDVLSVREAKDVSKTVGAKLHATKSGRGVIGALAAIGAELDRVRHTFEIIAYRTKDRLGTRRLVDKDSVRAMDLKYRSKTFHNLDGETGRILVSPHGPDPVLLGIRGLDPHILLEALNEVKLAEPVERVMIFRTNQGTDAHLTRARKISELEPFQSAVLTARIDSAPRVLRGGHVIFRVRDETGVVVCAAYKPTGLLMKAAQELFPGDKIRAYGGVRLNRDRSLTLNLERLAILDLVEAFREENPRCTNCGTRCESMGRDQGFRCKKCGLRTRDSKIHVRVKRNLTPSVQIPPPRSRRHLTRPGTTSQDSNMIVASEDQFSFERLLKAIQPASTS